ncbi:MAG: protein kinase domain-containing protein [Lachnospiraceae bacterium]
MDVKRICYNCFQERQEDSGPCPYCGFDLEENQKKFPVALRAGTILNNRYVIGRVLGQGGFGITYLALDTQLEARVAIKEFMPSDIATRTDSVTVSVMMEGKTNEFNYGAERFQEEARTLAKFIGHPNIAGVSSYFDENDTSYFVMDYIEGISFKSYIANAGGSVSIDEALNVMIPVLRALTAVHQEGFIHRDVTPDNIYISKDGNVKLLDFGSARYSIGDKSKSLDVVLKVGYAPKEQYIRRGRQGPYTDVYSCAACLYAAITGYLPPESLERLEEDTLQPISQLGIAIPEYLDKAILKGLAVQPEDRFQSAQEFLDVIESQTLVELSQTGQTQTGQTQTGQAQNGTAGQVLSKKKISGKWMAAIGAAVVLIAGIGLFGGNIAEMLAPKVVIAGETYSTSITELKLEVSDLSEEDYENLQQMTALTSLSITFPEGMGISSLEPFLELSNLEELRLGTWNLRTLEGIETLTHLKELYLMGEAGRYTSLEPIGKLDDLRVLRLPTYASDLEIYADISPLAQCVKLEELTLDHKVADLSPLSGLTNLTVLNLANGYKGMDGFQTLEPLKNLSKLTTISLRNYRIQDLSGLEKLHALESLSLEVGAQLTDISALRNLENLTSVSIRVPDGKESIYDKSPVDHVPNVNIS